MTGAFLGVWGTYLLSLYNLPWGVFAPIQTRLFFVVVRFVIRLESSGEQRRLTFSFSNSKNILKEAEKKGRQECSDKVLTLNFYILHTRVLESTTEAAMQLLKDKKGMKRVSFLYRTVECALCTWCFRSALSLLPFLSLKGQKFTLFDFFSDSKSTKLTNITVSQCDERPPPQQFAVYFKNKAFRASDLLSG